MKLQSPLVRIPCSTDWIFWPVRFQLLLLLHQLPALRVPLQLAHPEAEAAVVAVASMQIVHAASSKP